MYKVVLDYDGCTDLEVNLPDAKGTREDCVEFISKHIPLANYQFGIVNMETGRQVSFLIKPVARRRRLHWQDTKPIKNM